MKVFRGRRIDKPWGWELIWAESEKYAGKTLHVVAGESLSLQYHERKDETLCVLSGCIDMELHDPDGTVERARMMPGDCLRIPPQTRHRLIAVESSDVLEVSTAELDDVVRLEDRYGRVSR
jgi:mannose-6-phosphate isomerase-like protein (cupin superfamily)